MKGLFSIADPFTLAQLHKDATFTLSIAVELELSPNYSIMTYNMESITYALSLGSD
jgi:hypothetical protein